MQNAASTTIRSTSPFSQEHFNPERQDIFLELPTPAINHEVGPFRSHTIRHLITNTLFAACLCTVSNLHAEGDAYKTNPRFTAPMAQAQDLTRERQYAKAIAARPATPPNSVGN